MADETSIPTVDELEAKSERLTGDVTSAGKALDTAKTTFADAAKSDPTAVEVLLELATAVKAAEGTVSKAQSAVKSNQTSIEGIRYDEKYGRVTEASVSFHDGVQPVAETWFKDNAKLAGEFQIDTINLVCKREESGAVTVSVKPTGENMPKRPSSKRVSGGNGGTRGTRSITVDGESMSCRDYVSACGDQASPAAQADLAGNWTGAPVSYTNEAKRLAARNQDTFN